MKCRECDCCRKGYFQSKPESYVCIGVKEPFLIDDINVECTEYEYKKDSRNSFFTFKLLKKCNSQPKERKIINDISDCLIIGVDLSPYDDNALIVARKKDDDIYIINRFGNDEALELYNKLIGE